MERSSRWMKMAVRRFNCCKGSTWVNRGRQSSSTFDLLRLNGKDLQVLPVEERKAKLEELLKKPPGVIQLFGLLHEGHPRASGPGWQTWAGGFDRQTQRFQI